MLNKNIIKLALGTLAIGFVLRKPVVIGKCSPQLEEELREKSKGVNT